ncbi:MAG: hypothetical protein A2X13_13000 [Bacteroidetes bacterium GWC2_33_15]|nr:MAG: hypothetical protein A2X10_13695 [Bacteroidetes bacterium GWA2_33_15]OFX50696.1 MAG: hypothetical protein A2X13_13000 [Bacteroidetes bacterium GWC2_33_15]OFX63209.1 MAG: hypothetical protein A2X15_01800 [Bacteroidetes bacterium GWB2_32_14]OFX69845.1 MAG: hypothetical protein A2X14_05675 [Bacteroidetes bacterium GWD2_33_33]HAN19892.1 hypothetical protein [Bacteroidales bacterium]
MEFIQPSIEFLGIRIDEPVTTITDLMVSAVCFYAFYKLSKIHIHNKVHLYLTYYFLSMGIATAIGGIVGHGFLYLFNTQWKSPDSLVNILSFVFGDELLKNVANPWKLPGWLTSMFSIMLVERAAIEYARPLIKPRLGNIFAWINIIELATFVTITFLSLNFFFVEVHSAYGLLIVVTSFNLVVYLKTKSKGSKLFLIAVSFSALGALFFMNKWGFSIWFNHFDISHTLMTISAYFFYLGAKQILTDPGLSIK